MAAARKKPAAKKAKGHGGERRGAGRPKGGVSPVTKSIRDYVAQKGCDPLVAIADLMVWHQQQFAKQAALYEADPGNDGALKLALELSQRAADYAAKLGPYCAPRLASIEANVSGDVGVTIQIVRQGDGA